MRSPILPQATSRPLSTRASAARATPSPLRCRLRHRSTLPTGSTRTPPSRPARRAHRTTRARSRQPGRSPPPSLRVFLTPHLHPPTTTAGVRPRVRRHPGRPGLRGRGPALRHAAAFYHLRRRLAALRAALLAVQQRQRRHHPELPGAQDQQPHHRHGRLPVRDGCAPAVRASRQQLGQQGAAININTACACDRARRY